jgi:hypothetical protein
MRWTATVSSNTPQQGATITRLTSRCIRTFVTLTRSAIAAIAVASGPDGDFSHLNAERCDDAGGGKVQPSHVLAAMEISLRSCPARCA